MEDVIERLREENEPVPVPLELPDEDLLVERAVSAVIAEARTSAGVADVPIDRMRAGEVSANELAELLSPSLFAEERIVILESTADAGKDAR